jgi:hypothetical protein
MENFLYGLLGSCVGLLLAAAVIFFLVKFYLFRLTNRLRRSATDFAVKIAKNRMQANVQYDEVEDDYSDDIDNSKNQPTVLQLTESIRLVPEKKPTWQQSKTVQKWLTEIESQGFQIGDAYRVETIPDFLLKCMAHSEKNVYFIVYDFPGSGCWYEFFSRYENGSSLSSNTSPNPKITWPANKLIDRYEPGTDPVEVYQKHLESRPVGALKHVSVTLFAEEFERLFSEDRKWQIDQQNKQ